MRRAAPTGLTGLILIALAIQAEAQSFAPAENSRAPVQHPQLLFVTPQRPTVPYGDVRDVFEGKVYPPREILPPEAYEDGPQYESYPASDLTGRPLQQVQYPFEDSAAREIDPEGRYDDPRLNPLPPLTDPEPPESGFIWKDHSFTATYVPGGSSDVGFMTFDARTTGYFGGLPMLHVTPRFSGHLVSGPSAPDLPARLYDLGIEATLYLPLADTPWLFLVGVGPSMYSDFENTSGDAFRLTGRALAFYQWSETVKLVAGFLYLDRDDIRALPAGGVIYTPHESLKYEFMFPRPKFAYRYDHDVSYARWIYLAGELGGGSWAIERSSGADDVFTYRDYRLVLGWEHVATDWGRMFVEAGFVFNREIEYSSGLGDTDQSSTGMLRAGVVF